MRKHVRLIVSLIMILALAAILAGCGNKNKEISFAPEASSIYVCDDTTVLCATVEDFGEAYYDIDELKSFVEEQVIKFNESKGAEASAYNIVAEEGAEEVEKLPVAIRDCYKSADKAVLILECTDYSDFYEINNMDEYENVITSVEVTTISDMNDIGEVFDVDGLFKASGDAADIDKILSKNKLHVVKTSGEGTVAVQGIIKFVSGNVVVNSDATAAEVSGDVSYIIYS